MKASQRHIPFQEIAERALLSAEYIVLQVAPGGLISGSEYKALNPRRNDQKIGSFSINLSSGLWADFATGDKGGDVISYVAFCRGISQSEAARWLAIKLGLRAW